MNDDEKVIDHIIDFGTNDERYSFIIDYYSPEDSYILFGNLTAIHRVYCFFKDRWYRVESINAWHGAVTGISKTDIRSLESRDLIQWKRFLHNVDQRVEVF